MTLGFGSHLVFGKRVPQLMAAHTPGIAGRIWVAVVDCVRLLCKWKLLKSFSLPEILNYPITFNRHLFPDTQFLLSKPLHTRGHLVSGSQPHWETIPVYNDLIVLTAALLRDFWPARVSSPLVSLHALTTDSFQLPTLLTLDWRMVRVKQIPVMAFQSWRIHYYRLKSGFY
jgi:hypothetical protein